MLCMSTYEQSYVNDCRATIDAQVAAYRKAVAGAKDPQAVETFEPVFFNNLVIVLENYFVHRARAAEGKDGNPLNEVRVLCSSLQSNKGVMTAERSIKMKPEATVLGLAVGDEIRVTEEGFLSLAKGYFAEIETRYVA